LNILVYCALIVVFSDLDDDPYDFNEPDPVKCRAMESSLWELKVCFAWSQPCSLNVAVRNGISSHNQSSRNV